MIEFTFTDPLGNDEENPSAEEIKELIFERGDEFWQVGNAEVSLRCRANGQRKSVLYLRGGKERGFKIDYKNYLEDGRLLTLNSGEASGDTVQAMNSSGEMTTYFREYFVSPETAWQAVKYFLETGEKNQDFTWEKARYPASEEQL